MHKQDLGIRQVPDKDSRRPSADTGRGRAGEKSRVQKIVGQFEHPSIQVLNPDREPSAKIRQRKGREGVRRT